MTVRPGSLDYLYHNGILPTIPYEAYEVPNYAMYNGSQYLNNAKSGNLYSTYNNPDMFYKSNPIQPEQGENYSVIRNPMGMTDRETAELKDNMNKVFKKSEEIWSDTPSWFKGVISTALLITTLCCVLKKGKCIFTKDFWKNLNPLKIFKKS